MGTPDFAVPVLESLINQGYDIDLVVTQPDRPRGRKKVLTPPPVKVAAEEHNIPVFQPEKIKDDYEEISKRNPDLIITAAFGQILPKGLLDIPQYGAINVHASLLPALRGGAPIHYAILKGHKKTGISIMYMAEKLDAGDVISQQDVTITDEDDVGNLHSKLAIVGAELLIKTLPSIFAGKVEAKSQDESKVTYAPNISRDLEKIHWNSSAKDIYNQIRALHPWPVAFTTWQGKTLKIQKASMSHVTTTKEAGTIIDVTEKDIAVATGDGRSIFIKMLQPAGKKKMPSADFLRGFGNKMQVGERLGE